MKVYHGGTEVIKQPEASKGRLGLDFGQGFYVTDIQSQAESWADRMARIRMESGIVSVYDFDIDTAKKQYSYKRFDEYDESWLEFIVANRQETYRGEVYNIIEGGVANDRVIDTVEAYIAHLTPMDAALRELSKHRPNNQICICSQEILDNHLHFIESYNIG